MIREQLEAKQTKTRLIIIMSSVCQLPDTVCLFRQVASALKMDIQWKSEAATGARAYDSFNICRLGLFYGKKYR